MNVDSLFSVTAFLFYLYFLLIIILFFCLALSDWRVFSQFALKRVHFAQLFLIAFGKLKLSDDERKSEKTNQKWWVKTKGGTGAALRAPSFSCASRLLFYLFSLCIF